MMLTTSKIEYLNFMLHVY